MIKIKHKIICFLLRNRKVNFIEYEQMRNWAEDLYSDKEYGVFHTDRLFKGFNFYLETLYIMGYGYVSIRLNNYYELKERYDYFIKTGKRVI